MKWMLFLAYQHLISWTNLLFATIRAGSSFKLFLCFVLIDVRCFLRSVGIVRWRTQATELWLYDVFACPLTCLPLPQVGGDWSNASPASLSLSSATGHCFESGVTESNKGEAPSVSRNGIKLAIKGRNLFVSIVSAFAVSGRLLGACLGKSCLTHKPFI
jgi:hypothetical protein